MLPLVLRSVIAIVLSFALVAGADCPRPKDVSAQGVAAQSDEARLAFLGKLLEDEGARARRWTFVWGAGYGMLGIVQLAIMPLFTREEQPEWYWGAAGTAFGLAFTLLGIPEVMEAGPRYATTAAAATRDNRCALIEEGERLLVKGADTEVSSFQWYLHVGNVLFNVGLGLIVGLGYGHWQSAVLNTLVGVAIGEANILSGPAHLISGLKHYRLGEAPPALTFHVVPTAGPGVGVLLRF